MNFNEILLGILRNNNIIGAISSAVLIILFGFYLRKKKMFLKITQQKF